MLFFEQRTCPNKQCKRGRIIVSRGFWIFAKEHEKTCGECNGKGVITVVSKSKGTISLDDALSADDEPVRVIASLADSEALHAQSLEVIGKVENELNAAMNAHVLIPLPLRPELEK